MGPGVEGNYAIASVYGDHLRLVAAMAAVPDAEGLTLNFIRRVDSVKNDVSALPAVVEKLLASLKYLFEEGRIC